MDKFLFDAVVKSSALIANTSALVFSRILNVIYENVNSIDGHLSSFPSNNFVAYSQLIATCSIFHQTISSRPLVIDVKLLGARRILTYLEIEKLNNIAK